MSEHFLLPPLSDVRFAHEQPVVKLCNALLQDALDRGFERLEVSAPRPAAAISSIRAYKDGIATEFFDLPASMYHVVVRRFKAMARMRRIRPLDEQGIIRIDKPGSAPLEIRVSASKQADGTEDVVMNLPTERAHAPR